LVHAHHPNNAIHFYVVRDDRARFYDVHVRARLYDANDVPLCDVYLIYFYLWSTND